jgi:hypothetical protein
MIRVEEYFRKPYSAEQEDNARDLLVRVNALIDEAIADGAFVREIDPDTNCEIGGSAGGDGDGGFRTPGSRTGAPGSSHRKARGVDPYDPHDKLDTWLDTFETGGGGNTKLEAHGLYREAPSATPKWTHLTTQAPNSGKRTFIP